MNNLDIITQPRDGSSDCYETKTYYKFFLLIEVNKDKMRSDMVYECFLMSYTGDGACV